MKNKENKSKLDTLDGDIVTDVGSVSLPNIKSDIPIASARSNNSGGKIFVETSVEGEGSSVLRITEISIVGESNVALRVSIDDYNVAVVKVFSGMDELHKEGRYFDSLYTLHNVEAWHPLTGAPLRFWLRFIATLRIPLGSGSGLSRAALLCFFCFCDELNPLLNRIKAGRDMRPSFVFV